MAVGLKSGWCVWLDRWTKAGRPARHQHHEQMRCFANEAEARAEVERRNTTMNEALRRNGYRASMGFFTAREYNPVSGRGF